MTTATKYKPYPQYKPSGIDGSTSLTASWLGEIPAEWKTKRLRFVLNTVGGNGFPEELQGRYEGDYPFYKVSDINGDGLYLESSNNYVDREDILKNKWKIVPKDSIVTAKIGAALSLNHRKITKLDALIDNNMLGLSIKSKEYNLLYVYYLFKLIDLDWFVNPGAVPSVNIGQFIDTLLPLPSFPEQQSIADFLDRETAKVDEMVEKKQKLRELLKEKRQTLITHAVTCGLNENGRLRKKPKCLPASGWKPSGIDWLGDIPERWDVKKLKYISEITLGKMLQPEQKSGLEYYKPYLRAENIRWEKVNIYGVNEMWFNLNEMNNLRLQKNDLLVSEGGEVGRTAIWKKEIEECYIQNSVNRVRVIKNIADAQFLLYFFDNLGATGFFEAVVNRVSIAHLTREKLKEVEFTLPTLTEQKEIVAFLDRETAKIDEMMKKVETQIEKLEEYRQVLITSAVTGKIKI